MHVGYSAVLAGKTQVGSYTKDKNEKIILLYRRFPQQQQQAAMIMAGLMWQQAESGSGS